MTSLLTISRFSEQNPRYRQLLERSARFDDGTFERTRAIVEDVRRRGDEALIEFAKRFDGVDLSVGGLVVEREALSKARDEAPREFITAVEEAVANVRRYHQEQLPRNYTIQPEPGVSLGRQYYPISPVGVCVPGGVAPLCSSLIMNVVPALVAGVEELVVATAPKGEAVDATIMATAAIVGIDRIYRISGAHGVAAMAYGTETVPRVNKIVGPGNRWVTAAKMLVFGTVGIDSPAGPSEVAIVADDRARADCIAIDLLSQAEHGTGDEAPVAFVLSEGLARDVAEALETFAADGLSDGSRRALEQYGNVFVVASLDEAVDAVNALAPEHVEWHAEDRAPSERLRTYGSLFVGQSTPEAVGDYFAGANHVLPTQGTARFASGLTVAEFMRSSSRLEYSPEALRRHGHKIEALARAESMKFHGRSVAVRNAE